MNEIIITNACVDQFCHCAMSATRNGESSKNEDLDEIEKSIMCVKLYELTEEEKALIKRAELEKNGR